MKIILLDRYTKSRLLELGKQISLQLIKWDIEKKKNRKTKNGN